VTKIRRAKAVTWLGTLRPPYKIFDGEGSFGSNLHELDHYRQCVCIFPLVCGSWNWNLYTAPSAQMRVLLSDEQHGAAHVQKKRVKTLNRD